jgi:hypothetical protein
MTYKLLVDDTQKIIFRSSVRSALDPATRNLRIEPLVGEPTPFIRSHIESTDTPLRTADDGTPLPSPDDGENEEFNTMPTYNTADLVGRTFLMPPKEDGQRFRARVVKAQADHMADVMKHPDRVKFLVAVGPDQSEEIITYNQLLEYIEESEAEAMDDGTILWKFRRITGHVDGVSPKQKESWKGDSTNVLVEWENGEISAEPLKQFSEDQPVVCAIYARDNNLLNLPGWCKLKKLADREKKFLRMVKQAKLQSYSSAPKYKYGYEIPRNHAHALEIDKRNGNTLWEDSAKLELKQLDQYDTFKDLGLRAKPPPGYRLLGVHMVFDIKHDGRHKTRLVANGHRTPVPLESVYSGVVTIRGVRLVVFIAELNGLETWSTDIGNAYLEAMTKELLYIIAGPEFGPLEGHTMIVYKALYGLRTSGVRWHERFADCLREMGFFLSKCDNDIWMRRNGDVYEYIAVYVDDLAIAAKLPGVIAATLEEKYNFKLKGTGPITFHLGCDYYRDPDGVLCMQPRKYIEKMMLSYQHMFSEKPTPQRQPLPKGDHPELDDSELLEADGIQQYQSLIGSLQWAVTLGRIDIQTAVMSLSGFRTAPRKGHLERAKGIYGYLAKMSEAIIRVRTGEPDYSDWPEQQYDWAYTVYGDVKEEIPKDAPAPLGKYVTLSHYVDANLYHDLATGRAVTGILHFANKTPVEWYSKKQATVETATYGSEFVAARTCVEQIIDLRLAFYYLGVPLRSTSYMFGDNKTVVDSSMNPYGKLHKRHTALSFHRVREAVASGMVGFYHLASEDNPADILSKHWGFLQIKPLLRTLLFCAGDPLDQDDTEDVSPDTDDLEP